MFEQIKIYLLGIVMMSLIAGTWAVQDWRWKAKETNILQEQAAATQTEALKEAQAAVDFEKRETKSNEKYTKLKKQLSKILKSSKSSCFTPDQLRILNDAITGKTTHSPGVTRSLPGLDATG